MATNILHMNQIATSVGLNAILWAIFSSPKYHIEQILSIFSYQGKWLKYEIEKEKRATLQL